MKLKFSQITYFLFLVNGLHCYAQAQFLDNIKGNPKEYVETYYEAKKVNNALVKGKETNSITYVKDSNNVFVAQSVFTRDKWELPETKYSATHQKLEVTNYYDDGEVMNRTKYKYDTKGFLTEEDFYYASDTLITKTIHEYNGSLRTKSISYVIENGVVTDGIDSYTSFEYDKNKNLIREIYSSSAQNDTLLYTYGDRNFLTAYYRNLALYHEGKEPILYSRYTYKTADKYNWTAVFYEESIDRKESYSVYFIERKFVY
jgi:hypothetical protein